MTTHLCVNTIMNIFMININGEFFGADDLICFITCYEISQRIGIKIFMNIFWHIFVIEIRVRKVDVAKNNAQSCQKCTIALCFELFVQCFFIIKKLISHLACVENDFGIFVSGCV